jgi:hypothetical protein
MVRQHATALTSPWGKHSISSGETLSLGVGPLVIWARAQAEEIWLAHESGDRHGGGDEPIPKPGEDEGWIRWPLPEGSDSISLSPAFPPRPIVVEPELAFRLPPGADARIFVRVPLWARVEVASGTGTPLTEVPSIVLSDTWWGGFTEGELCYWLRTTARRKVGPEAFAPHLAVCPLQLSNRSEEELRVEGIALRVTHLSLFSDGGRLWADETRVRYDGGDEGSDIDMSGKPPAEAPDAVQVATARSPVPRGFRAGTVARLKAISGLGGW